MTGNNMVSIGRLPTLRSFVRSHRVATAVLVGCLIPLAIYASEDSDGDGLREFVDGEPIVAEEVNGNFDVVAEHMNTYEEAIAVGQDGSVGIGTSEPATKLQLSGTHGTPSSGFLINESGSDTGLSLWYDGTAATNTYIDSRYDGDSAAMHFRMKASGTPVYAMTVLGNGNIGMGTTAPAAILDVTSTSNDNSAIVRLANGDGSFSLGRDQSSGAFTLQGSQEGSNNIWLAPESGDVVVGHFQEEPNWNAKLNIVTDADSAKALSLHQGSSGDTQISFMSSNGQETIVLARDNNNNFIIHDDTVGDAGTGSRLVIHNDGALEIPNLRDTTGGEMPAYVCVTSDGVLFRSTERCL